MSKPRVGVPASSVLIAVDVQRGFVRPASAPVVPVIADLADRWHAAGGCVVATRYVNSPGSLYERLIGWDAMQPGDPDIELVPEMAQMATRGTVVDKRTYDSLAPALAAAPDRTWTDVYVCGIATESCVLATALAAFERGLTPWVIEDAVASHAGRQVHEAGLLVIRRFIGRGQIIRAADVLPQALAA